MAKVLRLKDCQMLTPMWDICINPFALQGSGSMAETDLQEWLSHSNPVASLNNSEQTHRVRERHNRDLLNLLTRILVRIWAGAMAQSVVLVVQT